jgi:predicted cytidylate kinase
LNFIEMRGGTGRPIANIAIGGLACSGKTTIAVGLAGALGWRHLNVGERLRELVTKAGLPIENFDLLDDETLRRVDSQVSQEMEKGKHQVWEGRLTIWLSRSHPSTLRVFCDAETLIRAQRYSKREGIELKAAKERILRRDNEETEAFMRLYGINDIRRESLPDIVLDTSRPTPEELIRKLLDSLQTSFVIS